MPEYMERDEWRFLFGDLRAASWVLETDPDLEPQSLFRKFLSIHQFFVRNAGRERPDLFGPVPREVMVDVVRRWIPLYRTTIAALATRYPRTPGTADLRMGGVNWSQELGVTYAGVLAGASAASRYAEYWAEKSLRSEAIYRSYEARTAFIGSRAYWRLLDLTLPRKLRVVDELDNAVPSFDLIEVGRGAAGGDELRRRYAEHHWQVTDLDDESAAAILASELS